MIPIYLCDDDAAVRREIRAELEKEILICPCAPLLSGKCPYG